MLKEQTGHCKHCSCRWPNFDRLTDEEYDLVNSHRFQAHFKAGEIIFKQGSPSSNAIFLTTGLGKIFVEGYDDKNIILALAKPTRLIVGPGTFVDNRHHYSLAAITEVSACFVDINIIKKLLYQNQAFAEGFLKDISHKSLDTFHKLISFSQKKMHGRLAEGLLHLANDIFESDAFNCALSRQELGELTGMTKESVVRLLKEFHDDRIIDIDDRQISIIDRQKLQKINASG